MERRCDTCHYSEKSEVMITGYPLECRYGPAVIPKRKHDWCYKYHQKKEDKKHSCFWEFIEEVARKNKNRDTSEIDIYLSNLIEREKKDD